MHKTIALILGSLLLFTFLYVAALHAQSPQSSPTPLLSVKESDLHNAEKASYEAQAEYYKVQTEQIRQRAAKTSFWQRIIENPGAFGVVGALAAAIVALFTFFLNYRATLQNQKDSQFYEALKRFGDPESATVRASAATILSQMAQTRVFKYKWNRVAGLSRVRIQYNLRTVFDQLITGLLLEDNPVCISTIAKSSKSLICFDPVFAFERLRDANSHLQYALCYLLAEFWGINRLQPPANPRDKMWQQLAHWVGYDVASIQQFVDQHSRDFSNFLESYLQLYSAVNEQDKKDILGVVQTRMSVLSHRLRACVDLLEESLERVDRNRVALDGLFLNKGVIDRPSPA